jgi:hypothetical protein
VKRQLNERPPVKEDGSRQGITLPRRRKPSFRNAGRIRRSAARLSVVRGVATHGLKQVFRFQAPMHFSAYLMIAAMVLMGLQLAYAFYQLAGFFL